MLVSSAESVFFCEFARRSWSRMARPQASIAGRGQLTELPTKPRARPEAAQAEAATQCRSHWQPEPRLGDRGTRLPVPQPPSPGLPPATSAAIERAGPRRRRQWIPARAGASGLHRPNAAAELSLDSEPRHDGGCAWATAGRVIDSTVAFLHAGEAPSSCREAALRARVRNPPFPESHGSMPA